MKEATPYKSMGQSDKSSGSNPTAQGDGGARNELGKDLARGSSAVADTAKGLVDDIADGDFSAMRERVSKRTQTVGELAQKQAASARDQVAGAVGAVSTNLSQTASAAQDTVKSVENDLEDRIRHNPWAAVAIAAGIGFLIAKLS